ncbi:MAG: hypothetical protein CL569_10755 [Alphaproteobacteria bacterium]|nr:hypothetical protein [Alphaproteobacteria bacterium]|tara:strand:- start:1107 stop:1361 length:255 start_codon:yes stop_codon:yes gene_type:complete
MTKCLVAAGALLLMASSASAQMLCKERTTFLRHLGATYSEAPVAMGLANNGSVLEVLSSKGGGTWTIIVTKPSGLSCIVASGEA